MFHDFLLIFFFGFGKCFAGIMTGGSFWLLALRPDYNQKKKYVYWMDIHDIDVSSFYKSRKGLIYHEGNSFHSFRTVSGEK